MSTDTHLLRRRIVLLVVFFAVCAAIFLQLLSVAGGLNLGATHRVEAVVPDAQQVLPQADVRIAGVKAGRVTEVGHRGPTAVLALEIDEEHGPVRADARVRVRQKTVVGENYVDLDPGTAQAEALPDGGTLPLPRAQDAVQLDQVLSTLDGPRRERLQRLLTGVGDGLADPDDLNGLVESLSGTFETAAPVFDALAAERRATARLAADLGTVFGALGSRGDAIRRLAADGRAAARAFAAQDDAVRATLAEAAPTLRAVRGTTGRLARVGERAGPLLDDLTGALGDLTPAVRDLPATSRAALRALDRLEAVTPKARRLLGSLRATAGPTRALVPELDDLLRELRPTLAHVAPHAQDAAYLFATLRAASDYRDDTSHVARVIALFSASLLVTFSDEAKEALDVVEGLGLADVVRAGGVNPYGAPGTGSDPRPLGDPYPRITRDDGP